MEKTYEVPMQWGWYGKGMAYNGHSMRWCLEDRHTGGKALGHVVISSWDGFDDARRWRLRLNNASENAARTLAKTFVVRFNFTSDLGSSTSVEVLLGGKRSC